MCFLNFKTGFLAILTLFIFISCADDASDLENRNQEREVISAPDYNNMKEMKLLLGVDESTFMFKLTEEQYKWFKSKVKGYEAGLRTEGGSTSTSPFPQPPADQQLVIICHIYAGTQTCFGVHSAEHCGQVTDYCHPCETDFGCCCHEAPEGW